MLCKKCYQARGGIGFDINTWIHCHHEEDQKKETEKIFLGMTLKREEKPKEKCWCEEGEEHIIKKQRWLNNKVEQWSYETPTFCPDCGRKIEAK